MDKSHRSHGRYRLLTLEHKTYVVYGWCCRFSWEGSLLCSHQSCLSWVSCMLNSHFCPFMAVVMTHVLASFGSYSTSLQTDLTNWMTFLLICHLIVNDAVMSCQWLIFFKLEKNALTATDVAWFLIIFQKNNSFKRLHQNMSVDVKIVYFREITALTGCIRFSTICCLNTVSQQKIPCKLDLSYC